MMVLSALLPWALMVVLFVALGLYGWRAFLGKSVWLWLMVPALAAGAGWRFWVTVDAAWWEGPLGVAVWVGVPLALRYIVHGVRVEAEAGRTPGIGLAELGICAVGGLWLGWGELPSFMALVFVLALAYLPLWGWWAEKRGLGTVTLLPIMALSVCVHVLWARLLA